MSINLQLVGYSPSDDNPSEMILKATFVGNYGNVGGTGDAINLTPYAPGTNASGFTDPNGLFAKAITTNPDYPPASIDNLAGAYTQAYLGATPSAAILRCFAANGTELNQGGAYPAAFLNGVTYLKVPLPERTTP